MSTPISRCFLFHRSLRVDDNRGLLAALSSAPPASVVLPVFCLDPRQYDPAINDYCSPFCVGFMLESLRDLRRQLRALGSDLLVLRGVPHEALAKLFSAACCGAAAAASPPPTSSVVQLHMNRDYSPFSRARVEEIAAALRPQRVEVVETAGEYYLYEPGSVRDARGRVPRSFTQFRAALAEMGDRAGGIAPPAGPLSAEHCKRLAPRSVVAAVANALGVATDESGGGGGAALEDRVLGPIAKFSPACSPSGRAEALRRLESLPATQSTYHQTRDYLLCNTTQLSPFIKFGCISVREAYAAFAAVGGAAGTKLVDELLWRDFFASAYFVGFPQDLEWTRKPTTDSMLTTCPADAPDIVRACCRELESTGYINNRARLIIAYHFLKYLYWKTCDGYFARYLVDYDIASNVGGWRWVMQQPIEKCPSDAHQRKWDSRPAAAGGNSGTVSYVKFWTSDASLNLSSLPREEQNRMLRRIVHDNNEAESSTLPAAAEAAAAAAAEARVAAHATASSKAKAGARKNRLQ